MLVVSFDFHVGKQIIKRKLLQNKKKKRPEKKNKL